MFFCRSFSIQGLNAKLQRDSLGRGGDRLVLESSARRRDVDPMPDESSLTTKQPDASFNCGFLDTFLFDLRVAEAM